MSKPIVRTFNPKLELKSAKLDLSSFRQNTIGTLLYESIYMKASTQRFIPITKADLLHCCLSKLSLDEKDTIAFADLAKLIASILHFEYHETLETLKENYAPFDPNTDTKSPYILSIEESKRRQTLFAQSFATLLNAANFEQITEQDLKEALEEESLFKVRLAVDFTDFEEVVFYRRGAKQKTETVSKFWGLKKHDVTFTNYEKVAVYIKFKDAEYFKQQERDDITFEPSSTIIKLFQNVPKADLEMLFPNSEVRMRQIDKVIIGGSAVIGGTVMLVTKLGATILLVVALISYWIGFSDKEITIGTKELLALGAGMGVIGGFIFKEWDKFKNRKLKFMKALADNLYFKNLDNNAGVFHHLLDAAEEEECKEILLAYYILLTTPEALSQEELDIAIEAWFAKQFNIHINFEVRDALNKLERFGIVHHSDGKYQALSLNDTKTKLNNTWDELFSV